MSDSESRDNSSIKDDSSLEVIKTKYQVVADDLYNTGNEEAANAVIEMLNYIVAMKKNEYLLERRIAKMDGIIGDLTINYGDATAYADNVNSSLHGSIEDNIRLKKELDSAHLREQDYQSLIDSLRSQTEFLESEMDKVKKEQDDLATELGISGRTKEAFYKEREKLKKENASLKSELGSLQNEHEETSHQLDQTKTELTLSQHQLDELKLLNEELQRDKGYMTKDAALQRSLVHQLKKNLILLKSHHDCIRQKLSDTSKHVDEQKTNLFGMQHVNTELRKAIRNDQKEISNLNRKVFDLTTSNADYKSLNKENEKEVWKIKKQLNQAEKREKDSRMSSRQTEIKRSKVMKENVELAKVRQSVQYEINGMESQKNNLNQAYTKLNRDYLLISAHLLKTTNLAADSMKKLELELRVRRNIEVERDKLKNEVHKYFIINLSLISQKDRYKQDIVQLEQKLEEELLFIRHKEHNIADLKKEVEEKKMTIKKHVTLYDEIKAERNVIARAQSEAEDMNEELRRQNKTLAKQLDQLKEQIAIKDYSLIKAERINKRKMNEGVKLKWQLTKSRNQVKTCKDITNNLEKDQVQNFRILEKALKERITVKKSLSKAVNDKAVILTQLDRKTAELNCLQDNVNFMDFILKKGDRQYNQRLDDIRILRLEVIKLRREKAMVIKALNNSADLRQEVYHLYAELNNERTKSAALEQEVQTPINYHRWRVLQGSDPEQKYLIEKVSTLQKHLIKARDELSQKNFDLDELKAVDEELKSRLERMPGFEVYSTISDLRTELGRKEEEIKTLSSVLACTEFQLHKFKLEDETKSQALEDFKKKYYEQKKINDQKKLKQVEQMKSQGYCQTLPIVEEKPKKKSFINDPSLNIPSMVIQPVCCKS